MSEIADKEPENAKAGVIAVVRLLAARAHLRTWAIRLKD
jgi:hypothetical protein